MCEESQVSDLLKINSSLSQGSLGNAPIVQKYTVKTELLALFETVGAKGNSFLISELMGFLKDYIKTKMLYDPLNPISINAEHDTLGKVFNCGKFNIPWAMKKLYSFLLPVGKENVFSLPGRSSDTMCSQMSENSLKRKLSVESTESSPKRRCPNSPPQFWFMAGPPYNSDNETVLSYQAYETDYVKDTTDWSLSDEDVCADWQSSGEGSVYFVDEDQYNPILSGHEFEYEVTSPPMDDDETDSASVDNVIAEIIVHDVETDLEFWADSSNCGDEETSDDPDITDMDKWQCKHCKSLNSPTIRYCERCWQLRHNWLPEHHREPKRLRRKRKRDQIFKKRSIRPSARLSDLRISNEQGGSGDVTDLVIEAQSLLNEDDEIDSCKSLGTEDEVPEVMSQSSTPSSDKQCSFCCENFPDGCIVHGSTGHLMGCYSCLKKLKRSGQLCPLCRGPIQKVIRVFNGQTI